MSAHDQHKKTPEPDSLIESPPDRDPVADDADTDARRDFLRRSVKAAAFVVPVVMFFKPREAVAGSGGSAITPGP